MTTLFVVVAVLALSVAVRLVSPATACFAEVPMLRRVFGLLAFLVAFSLLDVGSPVASAQSTSWTPELSLTVKRIPTVVPSPDGTKVAFAVSEAVTEADKSEWLAQIHLANADGTDARQLTRGDKSATLPQWSPDGIWIGFISSRSGIANVWRISVAGGEAEQITNEKGAVAAFDWAPDGMAIAFIMTDLKSEQEDRDARDKRDWRTVDENVKMKRLYLQPVPHDLGQRGTARRLAAPDYSVEEFDWAPDGSSIAFRHQPTPAPSDARKGDISLVRIIDSSIRVLAGTGAAEQSPRFSPDGKQIAFTASDDPVTAPGSATVHIVAIDGGAPRSLADMFDGQPSILDWTADGAALLVSETQRTSPTVYVLPLNGRPPVSLSPSGTHISAATVNARGTHLGFVSQDFDKAPEAFVATTAGRFAPIQVSHVQPRIDAAVGNSAVVSWKSLDGQTVEGILSYPVEYRNGNRVPLLVIIHGGPAGVFTNTFMGSVTSPYPMAVFTNSGYALLRVNPRGSSGYGKPFRYANMRDWGGGDYQDIMTGVDHVIHMGVADPERLGVMGWSYGGYLTAWIVTQTKRFKAASAGAAITDLISMTGTSDLPGLLPEYFKGEVWEVFDLARARSPVLNARSVTTPTLIQHGDADVRVPVAQSYELYNALKRQGVTTKLTVYPRQPHGFVEPKMTLDAARANLAWFDRFVKGSVTVTTAK